MEIKCYYKNGEYFIKDDKGSLFICDVDSPKIALSSVWYDASIAVPRNKEIVLLEINCFPHSIKYSTALYHETDRLWYIIFPWNKPNQALPDTWKPLRWMEIIA